METSITNLLSQPGIMSFIKVGPWILVLLLVWSITWKGVALWKAARLGSRNWFVVLLIVNTFGVLEIIYIYFIAKKYTVEVSDQTRV
jgi:hypothetical protein